MMPANRGVGAASPAAAKTPERAVAREPQERCFECLLKIERQGDAAAALASLLPVAPAPAPAVGPEPVPAPAAAQTGQGRAPQAGCSAGCGAPMPPIEEDQAGSAQPRTERGAGGPSSAVSTAIPPQASEPVREPPGAGAAEGGDALPPVVLDRLAEAARQAARERRPVTVLELEPPGGGTVEIRLDSAANRPALRLICHGWNGYLPLARELPALQARLLQSGVVLQDISLVFDRKDGDRMRSRGGESAGGATSEDEDGSETRLARTARGRR